MKKGVEEIKKEGSEEVTYVPNYNICSGTTVKN